jgi:Oxidoreductase NAD-binding domain
VSTQLRTGDVLDVSEPRGAFTLRRGGLPVVLLSAGVGVTPVMAMLHALAAQASVRPVWWIFGARNRGDHPFAREARDLLAKLPNARGYVQYSCGIGSWGRPASESGRLCHGDGATRGGDRCRSVLMLPTLFLELTGRGRFPNSRPGHRVERKPPSETVEFSMRRNGKWRRQILQARSW